MIDFVKKAGKTLLAVATGAVLSFSATQAIATPPDAPAPYECSACIEQCIEMGFSSGWCTRTECYCH